MPSRKRRFSLQRNDDIHRRHLQQEVQQPTENATIPAVNAQDIDVLQQQQYVQQPTEDVIPVNAQENDVLQAQQQHAEADMLQNEVYQVQLLTNVVDNVKEMPKNYDCNGEGNNNRPLKNSSLLDGSFHLKLTLTG